MTRMGLVKIASIAACLMLVAATGGCFGGGGGGGSAEPVVRQGWSAQQLSDWYGGKQGSRLMPYAWFKALEQPDNDRPFLAADHMESFRFLGRTDQPLPVGFAVDDNKDDGFTFSKLRWYRGQPNNEQWVGLNCSACHTGAVAYGDQPPLRIDGGPSLVDFQLFIETLDRALIRTRDDPAKWDRFAKAVLAGDRDTPANRDLLKAELGKLVDWQARVAALDRTPIRYGYGRLDAVGKIFNKVALFVQPVRPIVNPPDAPVSYPFLWDIWRQDKLQWNGIAASARLNLGGGRFFDYGAMGRNTGEVIGVFGDVDTRRVAVLKGFHSSVWADNLDRLEIQLRSLKAPVWPAQYFPVPAGADAELAERRRTLGKTLFADKGCASCHQIVSPDVDKYEVKMVPLRGSPKNRTDIWMACNAFTFNAMSGNLAGVGEGYFNGRKLGELEPSGTLLATMVKGTLIGKKGQILSQTANTFLGVNRRPDAVPQDVPPTPEGQREARRQRCITEENELLAYKARPLDGIWATAPYLHNGSVPTLFDLLQPADRRPKTFMVGTRLYDPVKVGYRTDAAAAGNSFTFDTAIEGNRSEGHDYGVGSLSDEERWSLVEYMKTL